LVSVPRKLHLYLSYWCSRIVYDEGLNDCFRCLVRDELECRGEPAGIVLLLNIFGAWFPRVPNEILRSSDTRPEMSGVGGRIVVSTVCPRIYRCR